MVKKRTVNPESRSERRPPETDMAGWGKRISGQDAAGYINDMALELKSLAQSTKLNFLTYLLELVVEESAVQKRRRH